MRPVLYQSLNVKKEKVLRISDDSEDFSAKVN